MKDSPLSEEERARLASEFKRLWEAGLGDYISGLESSLVDMLVSATSQDEIFRLQAHISALRDIQGFVHSSIGKGRIALDNIKKTKRGKLWH